MIEAQFREARAEVDLSAISSNVAGLLEMIFPASLCAVVKANAYGHGAVPVARAALEGGAKVLAVAFVEEGLELRSAGIETPVLVMSETPPAGLDALVGAHLTPTVYSSEGLAALEKAVRSCGAAPVGVHLKVDSGMHRVGARPELVLRLAQEVASSPLLHLGGTWTHFAVAELAEDDPFTASQLSVFDAALEEIRRVGVEPGIRHAANSAGALLPAARYDMVRCGISIYGYPPDPRLAERYGFLRPALSLKASVRSVLRLSAGSRPSYGRRRALGEDSTVANLALGYADGVPWRLFEGGVDVLLRGRRVPLAGAVTMDQVLLDCGGMDVTPGEEVVLLGRQRDELIDAQHWASAVGTIVYEVLTGIGPRVRRTYVGGGGSHVG